jgi:DNA polymerase-3 subunit epsilon
MAQLNLKRPIAFFDLETTGTNPVKDRIIEIAVVKINPDGSRENWVRRINPEMHIPAESSAIHGIYDEDVAGEPTFAQVAHELKQFLNNCDLGGYNSNQFDLPLLAESFLRANVPVDFRKKKKVDVQQIFFKKEARTLTAALKFYCQKDLENAHAALSDVNATIDVLEAQLDRYDDLQNDIDALDEFTGNNDFLDYSRRIILKDKTPYFNFGKHKGKAVETIFKQEPQYYDWMMQSDFSLDTKQVISEILNNMFLKKNAPK